MYTEHKPYEPAFYSSVNNDWGTSLLLAQGRRPGQVPRRPRPPPAQHQHRAGGVAPGDGGKARRLPLQRLEVRRRRPHRRLHHPVPAVPHPRRAAGGRERAHARRRLHDRREPQPEGPARGPDPGHRRHPGGAGQRCASTGPTADAQQANDPARAAEVLHRGFRTDVRPLVAEARRSNGAALDPLATYRAVGYRARPWRTGAATPWPRACRPVAAGEVASRSTSARPRSGCAGSTSACGRSRSCTATPTGRSLTAGTPALGLGPAGGRDGPRPGPGRRAGAGGVHRRGHVGRGLRAARRPGRSRGPAVLVPGRPHRGLPGRGGPGGRGGGAVRPTGVQLQPFNTLFQVAAHDRDEPRGPATW